MDDASDRIRRDLQLLRSMAAGPPPWRRPYPPVRCRRTVSR